MALQPIFILYIVVVYAFIVTSIYMFKPKGNETVHLIFFWQGVALACLVTFISATSLPTTSEYVNQIIFAWCGLLPAAVGIIIRMATGKTNAIANVLVMISTVYGAAGYIILS